MICCVCNARLDNYLEDEKKTKIVQKNIFHLLFRHVSSVMKR